jgi:hypothetical protein
MTMPKLSAAAESALAETRGFLIGAVCPAQGAVYAELVTAGMIGRHGGLTVRGSIRTERLKNAKLDALFGAE